jgi:hypothetical protein
MLEYTKSETGETIACLKIEDQMFEGRGINRLQAKVHAFKRAVKFYDKDKKIVFF